jgi:hypothetical protein
LSLIRILFWVSVAISNTTGGLYDAPRADPPGPPPEVRWTSAAEAPY